MDKFHANDNMLWYKQKKVVDVIANNIPITYLVIFTDLYKITEKRYRDYYIIIEAVPRRVISVPIILLLLYHHYLLLLSRYYEGERVI